MNFPPINAVDDGVFIYVGISLLTGFYGSEELWTQKITTFGGSHRLVDVFRTGLNFTMPVWVFVAFKNIYLKFDS